jgi:Helix-turn-helix domain
MPLRGAYRKQGRWVIANGGVRPRRGRDPQGRYLSFAERKEIGLARAAGESMRSIAKRLGRSAATISRELSPDVEALGRYRATSAHAAAWHRAARPKRRSIGGGQPSPEHTSTPSESSPVGCARCRTVSARPDVRCPASPTSSAAERYQ